LIHRVSITAAKSKHEFRLLIQLLKPLRRLLSHTAGELSCQFLSFAKRFGSMLDTRLCEIAACIAWLLVVSHDFQ
jgi:hypothetical protein